MVRKAHQQPYLQKYLLHQRQRLTTANTFILNFEKLRFLDSRSGLFLFSSLQSRRYNFDHGRLSKKHICSSTEDIIYQDSRQFLNVSFIYKSKSEFENEKK
jgi:hypothetical protein